VAVGQNLLNRNPNSTLATAAGLHPFLRLLFAHFGERTCPTCGERLYVYSEDALVDRLRKMAVREPVKVGVPLVYRSRGSHRTLLEMLTGQFSSEAILIDGVTWRGQELDFQTSHDIEIILQEIDSSFSQVDLRKIIQEAAALGGTAVKVYEGEAGHVLAMAHVCVGCGGWFGELRPVHFNLPCPHCAGEGCPAGGKRD
jgi:excinuclease ABC subunit A